MKRIRFTETVIYETEGYQKGPTFKEGTTHDFEDGFADRWLRRNKAVEVNTREPMPEDAPIEALVVEKADEKTEPKGVEKPAEKPAEEPKRSILKPHGKN